MLISEAKQNLQDAIEAYAKGRYCTPDKREALAALIADQPCVLTTGGASNQASSLAASFINTGAGDFIAYCEAWGQKRDPKAPALAVLDMILDCLVCVNDEGRKLLQEADVHFSRLHCASVFQEAAQ